LAKSFVEISRWWEWVGCIPNLVGVVPVKESSANHLIDYNVMTMSKESFLQVWRLCI